jgi:hypothetical protein
MLCLLPGTPIQVPERSIAAYFGKRKPLGLSAWQKPIRKTLLASYLFENQEARTTRMEIHCDLLPKTKLN